MPKVTKPSAPTASEQVPGTSSDLERRYAAIGIPAVAAAARYCAKNDEPTTPDRESEDRRYDHAA